MPFEPEDPARVIRGRFFDVKVAPVINVFVALDLGVLQPVYLGRRELVRGVLASLRGSVGKLSRSRTTQRLTHSLLSDGRVYRDTWRYANPFTFLGIQPLSRSDAVASVGC